MLPCALLVLAALHPSSTSSSRVAVEGSRAEVELVCQARSLSDALGIDADGDGRLAAGELEAARSAIAAYALERYVLRAGSGGASGGGMALLGRMTALEPVPGTAPLAEPLVRLGLRFEAERPLEELLLEVRLFAEEDPLHVDACELAWNGAPPETFLFGVDGASWWFRPAAARRAEVFASFFRLGLAHIATGYDHLAFLAGLLLAARRWNSLVGLATAFTAAHSLSLALAALDVVRLPTRLVELAIAISIAYVGALNLLVRVPSPRWAEASAFGLIHGLGFAAFLRDALGRETSVATSLVGFNLGVEAGQVLAVVLAAAAVARLPGDRRAEGRERAWLAPRWLRLGGSLAVALAGLAWFADRAGWLPL